ncbi:DUF4193 domain-containing protein [Corynebacterium liangguodongii]|uniref:Uncharacterized protein n=1 Tax=Corynebacterium liangguodongii TaxID=2079535 RepID=A0A2S0WEE2_9CORY|nr:DUF4193 domain-containing protein [Corynebacterium liangguodongii]AWB84145.1 hypothetical protein C3E79_06380 [Corynebacterium liangguodongii]PWC00156.1 DUF4193 domain-containing protein [Corynebacterium liangguodongii]
MATDYDAPRRSVDDDIETDSLEGLKAAEAAGSSMDDEGEIVDSFELPSQDLSGEELNVNVVPRREDEFTCGSCFLVQKKNRLAYEDGGVAICLDCE